MRFSRKMDDRRRIAFGKNLPYHRLITNVPFYESIIWIALHITQRIQIPRIGQFIQIDDTLLART